MPQPFLVVNGGDQQEVEDDDLEPVLDDRLPVSAHGLMAQHVEHRDARSAAYAACCGFGSHRLLG